MCRALPLSVSSNRSANPLRLESNLAIRAIDFPAIDVILKNNSVVMTIEDADYRKHAQSAVSCLRLFRSLIEHNSRGALSCPTKLIPGC